MASASVSWPAAGGEGAAEQVVGFHLPPGAGGGGSGPALPRRARHRLHPGRPDAEHRVGARHASVLLARNSLSAALAGVLVRHCVSLRRRFDARRAASLGPTLRRHRQPALPPHAAARLRTTPSVPQRARVSPVEAVRKAVACRGRGVPASSRHARGGGDRRVAAPFGGVQACRGVHRRGDQHRVRHPRFPQPDRHLGADEADRLRGFLASAAARREAWRRKFDSEPTMRAAEPNRGHRAVARLVGRARLRRWSRRTSTGCTNHPASRMSR